MIKLYEIMEQYKALESFDMDSEQDQGAFMQLLNELEGTFDQKAEAYCKVIKNLQGEALAYEQEKVRLAKCQRSLEARADTLKYWLEQAYKTLAQASDKRNVGIFTLALQKNPPKLNIISGFLLDDVYFKKEIDTVKIRTALLDGQSVNGAELVQEVTLRIK